MGAKRALGHSGFRTKIQPTVSTAVGKPPKTGGNSKNAFAVGGFAANAALLIAQKRR
jgi:hypothetical protein